MIPELPALRPEVFLHKEVWLQAAPAVGAAGYAAYRLGHDALGPVVARWLR